MSAVSSWIKVLSTWCVGLLCGFAFVQANGTQLNGAVYTTISDGTTVNANIYALRSDVYINGGPQNQNPAGLPDGTYFFQVTDPGGANLLSTDPAVCRQLVVSGGVVTGADIADSGACAHANGGFNPANLSTPVQLIPYNLTPNDGGEYKVWLIANVVPGVTCNTPTTISDSDPTVLIFSDDCAKTDNFKVQESVEVVAYVTVCKFNDLVGDGVQLPSDPLIPGWPIKATGVDAGGSTNQTVNTQTGSPGSGNPGCVTFTFTDFDADWNPLVPVTLTEGSLGTDWSQTFPSLAGQGYTFYTLNLQVGDNITVLFGNHNPNCDTITECEFNGPMVVSKDAASSNLFKWTIKKTVDGNVTEQDIPAGSSATFNYTVTVTHDSGQGWAVIGTITLTNQSFADRTVNVVDSIDNGGSCTVESNAIDSVFVGAGATVYALYTCTFTDNPGSGTNTVNVYDPSDAVNPIASNTAPYTTVCTGCSVSISDPLDPNSPHALTYKSDSPATFKYSRTVSGNAGTCTSYDNTATLTPDTGDTQKSSQTVKVCVGSDLTATKDATPSYTSGITKTAKQSSPVEASGSTTLNYTVTVTESGWKVAGNIYVTNPNDWEDVTVNLADAVTGATCTVNGGTTTVVVNRSTVAAAYPYSCTFASAPATASGTNTATVSWSGAYTPHTSTSPTANYKFASLTVTDTCPGASSATTLGTITTPAASTKYYPSCMVTAPVGSCQKFTNTASDGVDPNATADVTVCNTKTSALTMGFWQNNNGQTLIQNAGSTAGVCNLTPILRGYAEFSDLSASAPCGTVGSTNSLTVVGYVYTVIKQANSSGSGAPMLRGQMLATLLTSYFSSHGGTGQGTVANLGAKCILLNPINGSENVTPAFIQVGTCSSSSSTPNPNGETVSNMLSDASSKWTAAGCTISSTSSACPTSNLPGNYGNKSVLVLASDAFNFINNSQANIAP